VSGPTKINLDELERKALAATPGQWSEACWYGSDKGGWAGRGPHHEAEEGAWGSDDPGGDRHQHASARIRELEEFIADVRGGDSDCGGLPHFMREDADALLAKGAVLP